MQPRSMLNLAVLSLLLAGTAAHAQEDLKGSYQGRYEGNANPQTGRTLFVSVKLVIANVDSGKVSGTLTLLNGSCQGEYATEGTAQDGQLELVTAKGAVLGCGNSKVHLTSGPGKLSGKFGVTELEMTRIRM